LIKISFINFKLIDYKLSKKFILLHTLQNETLLLGQFKARSRW